MAKSYNTELILALYEYSPLSNVAIGHKCGVSEGLVRKLVKKKEDEIGKKIIRLGKDIKPNSSQKSLEQNRQKSRIDEIENEYGAVGEIAVKKFDEIVKEYKDDIQIVDMTLIAAFCNSFAAVLELQSEVRAEGRVLISPKGTTYTNPTYNALCREQSNMASLAKDLGLSILSRKRAGIVPASVSEDANSIFNLNFDNDSEIISFEDEN
jgi:P27 family predicted phage terminase small subunit